MPYYKGKAKYGNKRAYKGKKSFKKNRSSGNAHKAAIRNAYEWQMDKKGIHAMPPSQTLALYARKRVQLALTADHFKVSGWNLTLRKLIWMLPKKSTDNSAEQHYWNYFRVRKIVMYGPPIASHVLQVSVTSQAEAVPDKAYIAYGTDDMQRQYICLKPPLIGTGPTVGEWIANNITNQGNSTSILKFLSNPTVVTQMMKCNRLLSSITIYLCHLT